MIKKTILVLSIFILNAYSHLTIAAAGGPEAEEAAERRGAQLLSYADQVGLLRGRDKEVYGDSFLEKLRMIPQVNQEWVMDNLGALKPGRFSPIDIAIEGLARLRKSGQERLFNLMRAFQDRRHPIDGISISGVSVLSRLESHAAREFRLSQLERLIRGGLEVGDFFFLGPVYVENDDLEDAVNNVLVASERWELDSTNPLSILLSHMGTIARGVRGSVIETAQPFINEDMSTDCKLSIFAWFLRTTTEEEKGRRKILLERILLEGMSAEQKQEVISTVLLFETELEKREEIVRQISDMINAVNSIRAEPLSSAEVFGIYQKIHDHELRVRDHYQDHIRNAVQKVSQEITEWQLKPESYLGRLDQILRADEAEIPEIPEEMRVLGET
jgi:hypothetical protein